VYYFTFTLKFPSSAIAEISTGPKIFGMFLSPLGHISRFWHANPHTQLCTKSDITSYTIAEINGILKFWG